MRRRLLGLAIVATLCGASCACGDLVDGPRDASTHDGEGGWGSDASTPTDAAVDAPCERPSLTLTATPNTVFSGQSVVLTWNSELSTRCTATGNWSGQQATAGREVIPGITQASRFSLECTGVCGTARSEVTIGVVGYDYLHDADTTALPSPPEGAPSVHERGFPRIQITMSKLPQSVEQLSKYDLVGLLGNERTLARDLKRAHPQIIALNQISPRAYQGYLTPDPCRANRSMPFGNSGLATEDCSVFAGHWLYAAGTTLAAPLASSALRMRVADATRLREGQFAVIYDAPAGSFTNAEHVFISSVNTGVTPHEVTLEVSAPLGMSQRAYKSTQRYHPNGSIVATHELGQGTNLRLWGYNLATTCPLDANGNTLGDALAEWMAANLNRDPQGNPVDVQMDGELFDADTYYVQRPEGDMDNDLVADSGLAADGSALWGEGVNRFYARLRQLLPDRIITGGYHTTRGVEHLTGIEMEAFPIGTDMEGTLNDPDISDYKKLDSQLSKYLFQMHHNRGPSSTNTLLKIATNLYPRVGSADIPPDNSAFRLAFGLTLMDNGFFGLKQVGLSAEAWWDEYAVDLTPGSPDYGKAVASNPQDESQVRAHRHWMGQPLGPFRRLYDTTTFASDNNLLSDEASGFEQGLGGWTGHGVPLTAEHAPARGYRGVRSLRIGEHETYRAGASGVWAASPALPLLANRFYTVSFMAKASRIRGIRASFAGTLADLLVSNRWRRYILVAKTTEAMGRTLKILTGRESTDVWIDDVYVFEGNANVLRRDFENAVVLVNAKETPETIRLDTPLQRIDGHLVSTVNNGEAVTSVTLPPYDGLVLVRPE